MTQLVSAKTLFFQICVSVLFLLTLFLLQLVFRFIRTITTLWYNGIQMLPLSTNAIKSFIMGKVSTYNLFTEIHSSLKSSRSGMLGWFTPVGKLFLVIGDEKILEQVIVTNQNKLTKFHAFGILNHFRHTTLQNGPAWKIVHRIASKFSIHDISFQSALKRLILRYFDKIPLNKVIDFATYTKDFYWELVVLLCFGEHTDNQELVFLYKQAWIACIDALSSPIAHIFSFAVHLPIPVMTKYRTLTAQLRTKVMKRINNANIDTKNNISNNKSKSTKNKNNNKSCSNSLPDDNMSSNCDSSIDHSDTIVSNNIETFIADWCCLNIIKNEMSKEDQLEVLMEFLFTGASSVTATLIWMVWHIACASHTTASTENSTTGNSCSSNRGSSSSNGFSSSYRNKSSNGSSTNNGTTNSSNVSHDGANTTTAKMMNGPTGCHSYTAAASQNIQSQLLAEILTRSSCNANIKKNDDNMATTTNHISTPTNEKSNMSQQSPKPTNEWEWVSVEEVTSTTSFHLLDACLRETLRLYSPIHIGRLSKESFRVKDRHGTLITIPKGTDLFSNMWFIHRDESLWGTQAHLFDHTRFLKTKKFTYGHDHSSGSSGSSRNNNNDNNIHNSSGSNSGRTINNTSSSSNNNNNSDMDASKAVFLNMNGSGNSNATDMSTTSITANGTTTISKSPSPSFADTATFTTTATTGAITTTATTTTSSPTTNMTTTTAATTSPNNYPHFHPFSMGVRACPGQRLAFTFIKLIVSNLLLNFDIRVPHRTDDDDDDDDDDGGGIMMNAMDNNNSNTIDGDENAPRFDNNLMLPVTPLNVKLVFSLRTS